MKKEQSKPPIVGPKLITIDAEGNKAERPLPAAGRSQGLPNMAASIAASEAAAAGMSMDEIIHAAKMAAEADKGQAKVEQAKADAPAESSEALSEALSEAHNDEIVRRYFLSLLNYEHGEYLFLSDWEIMDAAVHVRKPVVPFEAWKKAISGSK